MTNPADGPTVTDARGRPARPALVTARPEPGMSRQAGATTARPVMLSRIADGRTGPAAVTVTVPAAPGRAGRRRVDAGGTRLRLRALHVMGHSSAQVARATGASEQAIQKLTRGQTTTTGRALRDTITTVYDAWWDKRPPGRTPGERAAAARARRRAEAGNWCAGAALDDDRLDTPGYQPACGWRPATGTGTGTAGDLHLAPSAQVRTA